MRVGIKHFKANCERRLDLGEVQPERAGEAERSEAEPIYIVIVGTI